MDTDPEQSPARTASATGGNEVAPEGFVANLADSVFPLAPHNRTTKRRALERITGNMVIGVDVVDNGVRRTFNDSAGEFHR